MSTSDDQLSDSINALTDRANRAESRVADLEAGIALWSGELARIYSLAEPMRLLDQKGGSNLPAVNAVALTPIIDALRALVGDETPGTGEHA